LLIWHAQTIVITKSTISSGQSHITGGAVSENEMQIQISCHGYYDCAGHHNLANTTHYSLQSIANATVSGRAY